MISIVQFTVQGIAAGSLYAIVALGLVLLYRGTRVLNFAHAEFGALGAYVFWALYPKPLWIGFAFVAAVAVGCMAGFTTERLVARPLRGSSTLLLAVATLAVAEILRFVIVKAFGPQARSVSPLILNPTIVAGRIIVPAQRLLILAVSVGLALGLVIFLRRTLFGVAVRAAAEDLTAVRMRGVTASRVTGFVWTVSAGMSAVAAILVSPFLSLNPFFMTTVLIRAFAAALVGGMTSLGGALVGGLVVGVLEAHLQAHTSYPGAVEASLFALIVAILLVRPQGLLGRKETESAGELSSGRTGFRIPFRLPRVAPGLRDTFWICVAILVAGVLALRGEYFAFIGAVAACYAIVGVSMYLLSGLSGQLSLGHAALMGAGGFGGGMLTTKVGLPYPIALVIAGFLAGAIAVAVGLPSFRIRGLYLAVSTLAFGVAAERFLFRLGPISGGSAGRQLPEMPAKTVLGIGTLLLFGSVVLARRVTFSKAGRALAVVHADETLAESWGIEVGRYKLLAFGLSGVLAGCAGVAYATLIGHVTSEAFTLTLSINLVAMAIVGGLGSIAGVIAGSVFFALMPELLKGAAVYLPVAHGLVLIAVILFLPRGVAQLWAARAD